MRPRSLFATGLLVGSIAIVTPTARVHDGDPTPARPVAATQRWAGLGPAFPFDPAEPAPWADRRGDVLGFRIPLGHSATQPGRTVLYRDGRKVGESPAAGRGNFVVPPGAATYRLHAEAGRSTRISADWTFASSTVTGTYPAQLPLLAVRFAPKLDGHHRAPAGRPFAFAMYVQRNGAARATCVHSPTVQVSYDDGRTWQSAHVLLSGHQWRVQVTHPAHARFVALRATARDYSGNTVRQTIIRAYPLT
jgi:hypothetical protein